MDYLLCGLRLASDIPLPELPLLDASPGTPEIEVRLGTVPTRLNPCRHEGPILQVGTDGTCRYDVSGVASFLIESGRRIVIEPRVSEDAPDIRVFLFGSVFGLLCFQRGWLPLHACCVDFHGRGIAIAADSGIGKSTLAATFARLGYRVVADDITVIDPEGRHGPIIIPAVPRMRLWRDVLDTVGLSADGVVPCRSRVEKFEFPLPGPWRSDPLPLEAVYRLGRMADERHAQLHPLSGAAAVDALMLSVYRRQAGERMGKGPQMLRAVHRLLQVPCFSFPRVHGLDRLDETVALLASRHQGRAAG